MRFVLKKVASGQEGQADESYGTFAQSCAVSDIGEHWIELYFDTVSKSLEIYRGIVLRMIKRLCTDNRRSRRAEI